MLKQCELSYTRTKHELLGEALASAIGCLLMGLLAKYPIATAPSLGINAFFAYSVCIGMNISWQTTLAGVLVATKDRRKDHPDKDSSRNSHDH